MKSRKLLVLLLGAITSVYSFGDYTASCSTETDPINSTLTDNVITITLGSAYNLNSTPYFPVPSNNNSGPLVYFLGNQFAVQSILNGNISEETWSYTVPICSQRFPLVNDTFSGSSLKPQMYTPYASVTAGTAVSPYAGAFPEQRVLRKTYSCGYQGNIGGEAALVPITGTIKIYIKPPKPTGTISCSDIKKYMLDNNNINYISLTLPDTSSDGLKHVGLMLSNSQYG